jgi:hypothetical protein
MRTSESEPQLLRLVEKEDDSKNTAKATSRMPGEISLGSRQWGMCTIGCMYRRVVGGGCDDTAMGRDGGGAGQGDDKQHRYVPIQNRLLVCQKGKPAAEGGRHRECAARARGPAHVHAAGCWQEDGRPALPDTPGRARARQAGNISRPAAGGRGMGGDIGRAPSLRLVTSQGCACSLYQPASAISMRPCGLVGVHPQTGPPPGGGLTLACDERS